ncbi:MAG: 3-dehydroquinate synthase [Syntrophaceae bacterium]|nr:3-dehydroquinate synthase [Syntrophaceae bacterium]
MRSIKVNLEKKYSSSYEIRIGNGIIDRIALLVAKNHKADKYAIITDDNVARLHGKNFLAVLKNIGLNADMIDFPAGEASKNIGTILDISDKLLKLGADRTTCLIALGGGVAGDMTGFIASVYMRGVPYVQIPTSLVAQVDSAIGGKTAIDLPAGKNLLGTFNQPSEVFADLNFLNTLPAKEFENGLAEIIKYGIIDDEKMFILLEDNMDAVKQKDPVMMLKIVENCCRIKKAIIEIDEREQGLRRILNYGHTLGHALEAVSDYKLSHGEGVALGMIAAARISAKKNYLDAQEATRIEEIIRLANLPTKIPGFLPAGEIINRLQMDKKKKGDTIHFVLLKKIGMPFINGGVANDIIGEVIEEMKL